MKMPSAGKVSACRGMFSFDPDEVGTTGLKPSQALPRGGAAGNPLLHNAARPSGIRRTALLRLLERIDQEMAIVISPDPAFSAGSMRG